MTNVAISDTKSYASRLQKVGCLNLLLKCDYFCLKDATYVLHPPKPSIKVSLSNITCNRFQTLKMVQLVLRSMLLIDRLVALRKLVSFFLVSQFIAHPNCQEYTLARWYFGNQKWRQMSTLRFTLLSMLVSMLYPVLSIIYILLPWDKFSRMVKTP